MPEKREESFEKLALSNVGYIITRARLIRGGAGAGGGDGPRASKESIILHAPRSSRAEHVPIEYNCYCPRTDLT